MRTKVTLVLLFLNVALFFFIFKFERNWRTERASLEARRRVLGPEAADIRSISVTTTAPGGSYALVRVGENWQLTQPLAWPANPAAVARIIGDLQFLEHETSFAVADLKANGQSLADYGLDQPKLSVEFSNGGGSDPAASAVRTTLRLGDTTKIGNRLYLLSPDGSRIHVVSRALADSLTLPVEQLRSDALFTIPVFEARSLRLQSNTRVAIRRDGGRWTFDTPIVARASKDAAELALGALRTLRAKSFVTESPPSTLPSAAPSLRITIEGNNRRESLLVGTPVPTPPPVSGAPPATAGGTVDYYAQIEGRTALFTVAIPSTLRETLDKAQETLREKRVLDFDPHAVTAITLKAPNSPGQPTLTLQRLESASNSADAAWQIVRRDPGAAAPQILPADRALVQRLLDQLSLLAAQNFTSDAPTAADLENWGFARPEREIALTLNRIPATGAPAPAAGVTLVLQLGLASQRDNFAYARAGGAASVYAVNPDILQIESPVTPSAWRDRLVRELPAGARIVALRLTDLAKNEPLLNITLDEAGNPPATHPQARAITTILAAARTLRAKSFLRDDYAEKVALLGEDRPWRYRLDATLALPGATAGTPAPVSSLDLSERIGGAQQLAGSKELDTVFELEQPVVDALWSLTFRTDPGPALPAPK